MKASALSVLVSEGLIYKKSRILCYRDTAGTLSGWLLRQRFNVEMTPPPAASVRSRPTVFDVVIVNWEQDHCMSSEAQARLLRQAMVCVRPTGHLVVSYDTDGLFHGVSEENVAELICQCFTKDEALSMRVASRAADESAITAVVKKGGAYKPRCPVIYIDEPNAFAHTCEALTKEPCLGLDVETTLQEPRILCTVQLATEDRVYVLDMLPIRDLGPLKKLMENSEMLKIIHNKSFEQKVLGHYGVGINNVYDTLTEARKRRKKNQQGGHKLGEVCERELGIYLDKVYQASDWTQRPLSPEQINYAAADAEVMIRLYRLFVPPKPPETLELF